MQVFMDYDKAREKNIDCTAESLKNVYKLPKGLFKSVDIYTKDCFYFDKK
jgi:hypothetical protein